MIDSEGYVFCQKLKAEGLKRILAASGCINELGARILINKKVLAASRCIDKLSENALRVLNKAKEVGAQGLLHLNKFQHADANGHFFSPDRILRKIADGLDFSSLLVNPGRGSLLEKTIGETEKAFDHFAKKDNDLIAGATLQKNIVDGLIMAEACELLNKHNYSLATLILAPKLINEALNFLDNFALEHGQDWRTKTGGVYVRQV